MDEMRLYAIDEFQSTLLNGERPIVGQTPGDDG